MLPLSFQDPCRKGQALSISRFAVLAVLFLTMIPGSFVLMILLDGKPYGLQIGSAVIYTAAVALYTFSHNRGPNPPFMLSCPIVRGQLTSLVKRHLTFLVALFLLQTTALKLRLRLPANWIASTGRDPSPFVWAVFVMCGGLALLEVLTNRSLLERAHLSAQPEWKSE